LLTIEKISGGLRPPLEEKEMLRALPLKPTKGSAFGICKLLKQLANALKTHPKLPLH